MEVTGVDPGRTQHPQICVTDLVLGTQALMS